MYMSPTRAPLRVLKNIEFLRCRIAFFMARSQRLLSSGAPALRRNNVSGSQRLSRYLIASPRAEFGSTSFSSELTSQPHMEIVHGRLALCLMQAQACWADISGMTRHIIVVVDHFECFDHVTTFFRKPIVKFHEVATAVRQTVCQNRVEFLGRFRASPSHI
jgi:hypothetical protein